MASLAQAIRNVVTNMTYEYSEIVWTRSEVVAEKSAGDGYCVRNIEGRYRDRENSIDGLRSREGKQTQKS